MMDTQKYMHNRFMGCMRENVYTEYKRYSGNLNYYESISSISFFFVYMENMNFENIHLNCFTLNKYIEYALVIFASSFFRWKANIVLKSHSALCRIVF